jgi:predicted homoserine dehydrogenase-like protein
MRIDHGCGSFDVRGEMVAIADHRQHMPIGLLENAVVRRRIGRGDVVAWDDVDIYDSLAARAWLQILLRADAQIASARASGVGE